MTFVPKISVVRFKGYQPDFKRYGWVVLIAVVMGIGATAVFAHRNTPFYQATATLVVVPNELLATPREVVDSVNALDRRSVVATFARVASSRAVRGLVRQRLRVSSGQLEPYAVKTVVVPDTNILEISVEGPGRKEVAVVANEIAAQTISYSRQFYQVYMLKALDQAGEAGQPVGPDLMRQLIAGGLIGFLVGVAAVYLLSVLERQSKGPTGLWEVREG